MGPHGSCLLEGVNLKVWFEPAPYTSKDLLRTVDDLISCSLLIIYQVH